MISVIICTYNRDKYIYRVLESLAQGNCDREAYEIVVIDNNCTDHTQDELQRFAHDFPDVCLRCFTETRQGLSHARNRGIEEARGELLVYVDDDATVKRIYYETDRVRLQPANSRMEPIYADEVSVLGRVIALLREF